jgi:hypothetical protein
VTITGGAGASGGYDGGSVTITAGFGSATVGAINLNGATGGGPINITAGDASSSSAPGDVTITAGSGGTSTPTGGNVLIYSGPGDGVSDAHGDVVIDVDNGTGTTGYIQFKNAEISTGGGIALTFGASLGPTGSTAGNQDGWFRIKRTDGTICYVPYWT